MNVYTRIAVISPDRIESLRLEGSEAYYLDFKQELDVSTTEHVLKLARHIAAMQVCGGYVLIGCDDHGNLTGKVTAAHVAALDEQKLKGKLAKYLPAGVEIRVCARTYPNGEIVVGIVTPRHPDGYAVIEKDISYTDAGGKTVQVFRVGDVFWRDGTSSVRAGREGHHEILRLALEDQREALLRKARDDVKAIIDPTLVAAADVAPLSWKLDEALFARTALRELTSARHPYLRSAVDEMMRDASELLTADADGADEELAQVLDRLVLLGVLAARNGDLDTVSMATHAFGEIYNAGFDDQGFLVPRAAGERRLVVRQIEIAARFLCLGAALVRAEAWEAARELALFQPEALRWRRIREPHTLLRDVGASAAHLGFTGDRDAPRERYGALVSRAERYAVERAAVRPELPATDRRVLSSVLTFDVLTCLAAVVTYNDESANSWWPGFSTWPTRLIEPFVVEVIESAEIRRRVFGSDVDDATLARALRVIEEVNHNIVKGHFGVWRWEWPSIGEFVAKHAPAEAATG